MKQLKRTVTITVEMTEHEYETLRLLAQRLENQEEYIHDEVWTLEHMVSGADETIIKMFSEAK
jgi:hypothetical protein